ncbi:MAG: DNA polymerase III subunit gamma/tau, partial [Betaproteobacteria bacterium]|nr:DNA polymerase III subunit gamma/tau [Betaproteobacteria bacterium]
LYEIAIHGRAEIGLAPDDYSGFTMTLLRMLAFHPGAGAAGAGMMSAPAAPPAQGARNPGEAMPPPAAGRASAASQSAGFDGDWPALAGRLRVSGMAKMLAHHCELRSFDGQRLELCVPEAHRHLLDKIYEDKVRAAVAEILGTGVRVAFSVGSVTGLTPAELENREKQKKQTGAIEAIEKDPFVRDMIEQFDARLIDASIKPIQ